MSTGSASFKGGNEQPSFEFGDPVRETIKIVIEKINCFNCRAEIEDLDQERCGKCGEAAGLVVTLKNDH